jgi:hypothetical protein
MVPSRRLCRAQSTPIGSARTARNSITNQVGVRHSPIENARHHALCPIRRGRGALHAIGSAKDTRQGSCWPTAARRRRGHGARPMASRHRHAGWTRKAPVLLARVFVVIGNAKLEPLARTRAILSDSTPALVRKVARGEDMRRTSGNLAGLICEIAHGERPGTKTGARAVPDLSLPPSLEERAMGESLQKSTRVALLDGVSGSRRFRQGVAARCHAFPVRRG